MAKRTIRDPDVAGKRVFIRVDFNVPLKKKGERAQDVPDMVIADDTRITASVPTIQYALDHGARVVVLASHLGRPKGKPNPEMSLRPVAARLGELLKRPVIFAEDCIGPAAEQAVASAPAGAVVLLENLRFHPEEEKNDAGFAKALASLADVYVNDAFGAAHRAHASVDAMVRLVPAAGAGLLMEKELRYLGGAISNPERPFVAVIGGAKVSDKIEVIENLIPKVDRLLIGGAMAYTFLKAEGKPVGKSLVEDDKLGAARDILARAKQAGLQLLLPTDHVVAPKLPSTSLGTGPSTSLGTGEADVPSETLSVDDPAIGDRMGLDIGPATVQAYAAAITDAKTVIWNGPMGVFEADQFAHGTIGVARAVAAGKGTTIIGGGDSVAAIHNAGLADRITHISTGGGASLEFLGGQKLPGVEVLPDA